MAEQKSILIVDDEVFSGKILQTSLREMGFLTDYVVATGEEAIELTEKVEFDLILMDLQLPGCSGFETAQRIRSESVSRRNASVPIIALSAYVNPETIERVHLAGMDGYIAKPYEPAELLEVIRRVLGPGRVAWV